MSLPPGLSMLWETLDPRTALRERFGFDDLAEASRWVSEVLAQQWRLDVRTCTRIVISDQNAIVWVDTGRGPLVVKWSRAAPRFATLADVARLLTDLHAARAPVAAPLTARDGTGRVVVDGPTGQLSLAVQPEQTGEWLDVDDLAAVRSAGASLARLHEALATVRPGVGGPRVHVGPLTTWLRTADPGHAPRASRRLADLLAVAPELDDEPQLVHHDFRAANLLTRGSQVVAVLDFDEVRIDHRVADLAKASTYLGTLFTDWRPTPEPARQALREGYASVRALSPAEEWWAEILELWHGLHAIPGPADPAGWAEAAETFVTPRNRA